MSKKDFILILLGFIMSSVLISCDETIPETDPIPEPIDASSNYIFTSDEGGKYEVWKFEDKQLIAVTSNSNKDSWWPKMSPDKSTILFYESNLSRNVNDYTSATLFIMNADGTNKKELIRLGDGNNFKEQGLANWSKKGDKIVFAALEDSLDKWQIYEYEMSTNQITRISKNDSKNYLDPIYSRDNESVFCITTPIETIDQNLTEVFEILIENGEEIRITDNSTRDHHPCLSPDGSVLIFESLVDESYLSIGKWDIKQFDLSSNRESSVISEDGIRLFPQFSEDGNMIYFTELKIETASLAIGVFEIDSKKISSIEAIGNNALNVSPY
jgi:Tol biopolymer transport system component